MKPLLAALFALAAVSATASAVRQPNYEPQYIFDGQYTAALQQHAGRWRLLPLRGDEVDVSAGCANRNVPAGLWYVTPDRAGGWELIAPSVTALPAGFPEHVALRACGDAATADATLFVPSQALDWIAANAGTVLIDD
jgi:hypothetical protein